MNFGEIGPAGPDRLEEMADDAVQPPDLVAAHPDRLGDRGGVSGEGFSRFFSFRSMSWRWMVSELSGLPSSCATPAASSRTEADPLVLDAAGPVVLLVVW